MYFVVGNVEVLSDVQCRAMLATTRVGRVAVTTDALPVIAPVNYVLDGNSIVFRTRPGGMLARACDNAVIAFGIDELAADGSHGWSVNVVGIASLLAPSEQLRALSRGLVSAAGDDAQQFVRLRIGVVTGRRIASSGVATSAV